MAPTLRQMGASPRQSRAGSGRGGCAAAEAARRRPLPAEQGRRTRAEPKPQGLKKKKAFFFWGVGGAVCCPLPSPLRLGAGRAVPGSAPGRAAQSGVLLSVPPAPPPAPAARPGLLLPVPACAYPPAPACPPCLSLPALPAPPRRALSGRQALKPALLIAGRELIYIYWRLHPLAANPFIFNKEEESCPPVGNG